jgi:hypothetical protein
MITAEPPDRVAAILRPLRGLAEEIVLALDSRVDPATIAGYAGVADVVHRIEFRLLERHLGWLHAQCRGDWILRLDGDELPSAALLQRLPELIDSTAVRQYWIARHWLYPDPRHALDEVPWSVDFVNCLVRNDAGLRFPGVEHLHAAPDTPCAYVEEPIYHLDLLLHSERERRTKAVRYEVERPHLLAAGGARLNEAFYLPELFPAPSLRAVPALDLPAIERALHPTAERAGDALGRFTGDVFKAGAGNVVGGGAGSVFGERAGDESGSASSDVSPVSVASVPPVVGLAEMDRFWEGRAVPGSAYAALIEPYESHPRMAPGEARHLFFGVTNQGSERWPWGLDHSPPIRLSYRWLNADGSIQTQEGLRSPFPCLVHPGETVLTALHVVAPEQPGRYTLEVDVVHEGHRWFGRELRVQVLVDAPALPAAPTARLRASAMPNGRPLLRRLFTRRRIPRVFHRVWLGHKAMPAAFVRFGETWSDCHPGWEMRLWTEADLPVLGLDGVAAQTRTARELSNLMRYEILARHGGVYIDTDFECLRSIEPLLGDVEVFTALELPGRAAIGVLGCVPGHPLLRWAAEAALTTVGRGADSRDANGPYFFSLLLEQTPGVTLFAPELFYPYRWDEPERRHESFPDAYAVHHWAGVLPLTADGDLAP